MREPSSPGVSQRLGAGLARQEMLKRFEVAVIVLPGRVHDTANDGVWTRRVEPIGNERGRRIVIAGQARPICVSQTFQVGGEGGWGYLTVDPKHKLLYVPRSTHTMVLDANTS